MKSHEEAPAFPADLPVRIDDPSAWYGPHMAARTDWIEVLSEQELDELYRASEPWVDERTDIATITKDRFPLTQLAQRAAATLKELLSGRGFALLRGIPVEKWGRRRSAVAF